MVTGAEATLLIGSLTLLATGGGWLARRDSKHKEEFEEKLDSQGQDIEELDTAFARLTQRLFGHPDDESDPGALISRSQRVQAAEQDIDSLSDEVQYAKKQAEENGDHLDDLDERVTEHAHQTRMALKRIEEQLDENLIPREDHDDFFRGEDD